MHDLGSQQEDAEGDGRLDGRSGHVHDAQRCECEGDRVRNREGGDGQEEHASAANDQDERQHEEEMIEAEEDVLDPVREVGPDDRERPARGRDLHPRLGGVHQRRRTGAVEQGDPHQHVGDGGLEPHELDALPGDAALPRIDRPTLHQRVRELLHRRLRDVADAVRDLQHDREAHSGQDRRPPEDRVPAGGGFRDLEVRWPDFMGAGHRRERQPAEEHGNEDAAHGIAPVVAARTCPRGRRKTTRHHALRTACATAAGHRRGPTQSPRTPRAKRYSVASTL